MKAHDNIVRRTTPLLAKRGWYCELNMPYRVLHILNDSFNRNDLAHVDAVMIDYVHHHWKEITRSCEKYVPHRWPILKQAFHAHKKKQYALAIPVFLAQADGICHELFGVQLYKRKNKIPVTADKVGVLANSDATDAILEPLRIGGAISAYDADAAKEPLLLNRHQVLHGLSVDYATEVNSFRAISLVAYVATALLGLKQIQSITPEQIAAFKKQFQDIEDQVTKLFGKKKTP